MMQIIVQQWPEMVEASSRYGPQSQFWHPQKRPKMTIFGSFSGLSEPSVVGDYKKSVSRASRASMSLESLFHNANYGETMAGNG